MTDAEGGAELPVALSARSYPWWVAALGAAVLVAFCYALLSLPHHVALARELSDAKRLDATGDYKGAESEYAAILADMPGSKRARIGQAHAVFADTDPRNDPAGLQLLAGLQLDQSDWNMLAPVMPQDYRAAFVEEKH